MGDMPGWKAGTFLLLEMGRITRGNLTRDEALDRIARLILDSFDIDAVAILVYEPASKSAYVVSSVGKHNLLVSPDITLRVDADSCLMQSALNPHRPLIVTKGHSDSVLGRLTFSFAAIVPMSLGQELTGFMILARQDDFPFFQSDPEFVMAVASQAAMIASKAALIENLKQSEERYHMLMENAGDLVFVLDRGGRFLYVNSQSMDMLGYKPEELCGRYFGEFVTPESWATTVSTLKNAVRNRQKHIEYSWTIQPKDGHMVKLDVRASLIYQGFELLHHQGIARDTSTEKRLWEEIEKREKALDVSRSREEMMREYLSVADLVQEEERARIARELHDGAIQYLVALRRKLDLLEKTLPLSQAPHRNTKELISDMDSLLDETIADLREFARNLRPPVLDDFGFVSACEWLCDQAEREGFRVVFDVSGLIQELPRETEALVFRIVQEGLSNAVKHSGADLIELRLAFEEDVFRIGIRDNGKGFDPPKAAPGSLVAAGQMGLVGMFERAELLGASLEISSEPGNGTFLSLEVPVGQKSSSERLSNQSD
ncbi:MAG: PAS domain S-box protein [Bacillota bacterium]|jgi:PAS domain S-box-containing protein|nr:PAS domain S-box protein [Candidatus Fermentithermobacillaceae bacterium]